MRKSPSPGTRYETIWEIVQKIPRGRVSTYGHIARLAGIPGHARQVGYALHAIPPGLPVPWQRVINAKGMISFPAGSRQFVRQERLLLNEGIRFTRGRIDLRVYGWVAPFPS